MFHRRLVIRTLASSARRALSTGSNNVIGAVKRGQAWYLAQLSARPLPTKAATAFVIVGGGDAVCQLVFERDSPFDWARWLRTSFLGGVLVGPSMHTWFNVLARRIPGDGLRPAVTRLLIDRLMFAPLFIPTYMFALMTLEGRLEQLPQKLRDSYFHTVLVNWKIWFPAQFITFRSVWRARWAICHVGVAAPMLVVLVTP